MPAIFCALTAVICGVGFYGQMIPLIMSGTLFFSMGNTAFHTATQELVPAWFKSVSYGVYVLCIQFFGALGPIIAGILSEKIGLTNALVACQALPLIAAIGLLLTSTVYLGSYEKARKEEEMYLQQTQQ